MKEAKDYYEISVLDGMLVSNKESVIEAIQMAIDDAEREAVEFAEWLRENYKPFGKFWCHNSSKTHICHKTENLYSLFKNKDNDTTR